MGGKQNAGQTGRSLLKQLGTSRLSPVSPVLQNGVVASCEYTPEQMSVIHSAFRTA